VLYVEDVPTSAHNAVTIFKDKCAADGGTGLIHRMHGVRMGQECRLNYCIENNNTHENRN